MDRITTGQVKQLIERDDANQVGFQLMQFILGNLDKVRELMLKMTTFKVIVDYALSLADMVKAGKYDWSNDAITAKNFPVKGKDKVEKELILIHPNQVVTSEQVIALMAEQGLDPAPIEDLLTFGASFPALQREFPVVALGSVAKLDGGRSVPCLLRSGSRRGLSLYWFADEWDGSCRFLAVRKRS